jgi:hypothetical protein
MHIGGRVTASESAGADKKGEQARVNHHFWFKLNGGRFSYVNIRKNACSAFRNFIRQTSPTKPDDGQLPTLKFLQRFHKETDKADILTSDFRIVVLRDPVARIASVFANKFIQKKGNQDIFHDYEKVTGRSADKADFHTFILAYVGSGRSLDPHLWTQRRHLLEIEYNAAMMIEDVHEASAGLFGDQLADRYFAEKMNRSGGVGDLCDTIDGDCLSLIKDRYAADLDLIERLSRIPKGPNGLRALRVLPDRPSIKARDASSWP